MHTSNNDNNNSNSNDNDNNKQEYYFHINNPTYVFSKVSTMLMLHQWSMWADSKTHTHIMFGVKIQWFSLIDPSILTSGATHRVGGNVWNEWL